jgi:hypothetical protein
MMATWDPATVESKTSATGTTFKINLEGQEVRVRYRTDRNQIEFWEAGSGWVVSRVQVDDNGAGIHVVPR